MMRTKIDIDQEKLSLIMLLKQFKTKKEAVNKALDWYLNILLQQNELKKD